MKLILGSQFAQMLSVPDQEVSSLSPFLDESALVIKPLEESEAEKVAERVRERIATDSQRVGTRERKSVWEGGWSENLEAYRLSSDWMALQPRYYTSRNLLRSPVTNLPVFRIDGSFVTSPRIDFEIHLAEAYRSLMFGHLAKLVGKPKQVVELGCGSGLNVMALARSFPETPILAGDYAKSAQLCAELVGERNGLPVSPMEFNFLNPPEIQLPPGSLVVTMGALEQIGVGVIEPMCKWILAQGGVTFFHSEPFIEMYDPESQMDRFLIDFAGKRGYTRGLLPALREAATEGKLESMKEVRVRMGSALLEGYNWVTYTVR